MKKDYHNILHLLKLLLSASKYKKEKVEEIHFMTDRVPSLKGGRGGGSAVLSAQKIVFTEKGYGNIPYRFTFRKDNIFTQQRDNELWDLWSGVEFAREFSQNERNKAYITHDYGTAFGLALLGKKFVFVCHTQGPRVEEKYRFGESFSYISKKIIQFAENYAFKKAFYVCFPSQGAYEYFCKSSHRGINQNKFKVGPTLYNTLYAYPKSQPIKNIEKKDDVLTFLSIGQMTLSKGMDRQPKFFEALLEKTEQKIRYICVGNGILREEIKGQLLKLQEKHDNFEVSFIPQCPYEQVSYLQDISDIYIMLHRISIFDLSTLEMMNKSKVIVLSAVGGNPEFNKDNNIIIYEGDMRKTAEDILNADFSALKRKNKACYEEYFSNNSYKEYYDKVVENLIL